MNTAARLSHGAPLAFPSRQIVVCVDDEPAILRSYARLLRHEPYDLLTFEHPRKALAWIERSGADLVLSDERMPEMSGTNFLEEVSRISPRTRCALITAYPEPAVVAGESVARIERLISKPWEDQDLRATIRFLLGHRGRRDCERWIREDLLRTEPGKDPALEVRVDAAGSSCSAVLDQVIPLCIWSHASKQRPVVVLENLGRFSDPLPELIRDVVRTVERLDARLSLRDSTGAVAMALAEARKRTAGPGAGSAEERRP